MNKKVKKEKILEKTTINLLLDFFESNKYLVVFGARGAGKTSILRALISKYSDELIGVRCISGFHFDHAYKQFQNCRFVSKEDGDSKGYKMLIGDEIYLKPSLSQKRACALSFTHRFFLLPNRFLDKEAKKRIELERGSYMYDVDYKQYEKPYIL